jgi:membrane fusion protein, multidrug efflux system
MTPHETNRHLSAPTYRMMPLVVAGLLFSALATGLAGLGYGHRARDEQERARRATEIQAGVSVVVAPVVTAPSTQMMTVAGEVRPWRQVSIYSKMDGYLESLSVDKGDVVKAGAILAVIQAPEISHQLASARADYRMKTQRMRRSEALAGTGLVAEQDHEQASGALAISGEELKRLKTAQGYRTLRAPFDGTVIARHVDPGALVTAAHGALEGTSLVDVADVSRVRIYVKLGQREVTGVAPGDAVLVMPDSDPAHAREEKIARLTGAIDPRSRTMLVEIDAENTAGKLLAGSFVRVRLSLRMPSAFMVPSDAITVRDGKPAVAIVHGGRATFAAVVTGQTDGTSVRVTAGVGEGDLVALFPGDNIVDQERVRPVFKDGSLAEGTHVEEMKSTRK